MDDAGLPRWLREALERAGVHPRRAWGQHFLHDRSLLQRQVAYAGLDGTQRVLEIGAGPGNLTVLLAERSRELICVEKDRRFAPLLGNLERRFAHLRMVWADALTLKFPAVDIVVANLPYGPALPLTFRLMRLPFQRAVLLYQLRLAQRLCARVGEPHYGRLSVLVGRLATVELLEQVPPRAFYPRPRVDSALVLLKRTAPRFAVPTEGFFEQVLRGLFLHREASLELALRGWGGAGAEAESVIAALGGRLRNKPVFRVTPREFGRISWLLWRAGIRDGGSSAKRP